MAESVVRSSTTSETSAVRPHASKKSAKPSKRMLVVNQLFAELARLAEMSAIERRLRDYGFRCIAGTDEVGRGCLAGPVVAACVILDLEPTLLGVNDSKLLDGIDRVSICRHVIARARAVAVGVVEPHAIDAMNILRVRELAMAEAVEKLPLRPDMLLFAAVTLYELVIPQLA